MKKNILTSLFIFAVSSPLFGQSLVPSPVEFELNSAKVFTEVKDSKGTVITAENIVEKSVFIHTATSIGSTEDLNSALEGTEKIIIVWRIQPQTIGWKNRIKNDGKHALGFDINTSMNILNLKPQGIPKDSLDLVSLMFPEAGNFGLTIGPSFHLFHKKTGNKIHRISTEASFGLRQNKIQDIFEQDSLGNDIGSGEDVKFAVLNINVMPIRYNFHTETERLKTNLDIGFYVNWFNIPNEDALKFNKLFPSNDPLFKSKEKSFIYSLGVKTSYSINGLMFFADLRYNKNTKGLDDNNPYKGFLFNAGLAHDLSIF